MVAWHFIASALFEAVEELTVEGFVLHRDVELVLSAHALDLVV